MGKSIVLGFMGINFKSENYGVVALAYSQLSIIKRCVDELGLTAKYVIFSNDKNDVIPWIHKEMGDIDIRIVSAARFKTGMKGYIDLCNNVKQCDIIFDITHGDSFADIYGYKRFILKVMEKKAAIRTKTKLVLTPQTIGPFNNPICRHVGKKIIKKSTLVCVRDELSREYAYKLSGRKDIILSSDLALYLPYQSEVIPGSSKIKVGLNISGMLWYNRNNECKPFGLKLSYKDFTKELVRTLLKKENYEIHLIAHVCNKSSQFDDYAACQELLKIYPQCKLVRKFKSPIEAKGYISSLDLFIGARMHATIGAFSSRVAVIPISYSRKFEGMFDSIKYNYCINCRTLNNEAALQQTLQYIENYKQLNLAVNQALDTALKRNEKFISEIKKLLSDTCEVKNEI